MDPKQSFVRERTTIFRQALSGNTRSETNICSNANPDLDSDYLQYSCHARLLAVGKADLAEA